MTHNVTIHIKRMARDSTDIDQVLVFGYALPPNLPHTKEVAEEARMRVLARLGNNDSVCVHALTSAGELKTSFVNPQILLGCLVTVALVEI